MLRVINREEKSERDFFNMCKQKTEGKIWNISK